jgi:hypothetical protein
LAFVACGCCHPAAHPPCTGGGYMSRPIAVREFTPHVMVVRPQNLWSGYCAGTLQRLHSPAICVACNSHALGGMPLESPAFSFPPRGVLPTLPAGGDADAAPELLPHDPSLQAAPPSAPPEPAGDNAAHHSPSQSAPSLPAESDASASERPEVAPESDPPPPVEEQSPAAEPPQPPAPPRNQLPPALAPPRNQLPPKAGQREGPLVRFVEQPAGLSSHR